MIEFTGRIVLTVICLGLVVVIHEFGHFIVARLFGVRVERFTVGFGPELFGWTRGETRYAVCAIPLGGMVKLAGEFMDERQNRPDEFFSQAWYRRIAIALAGPVMNYVLAFVLFAVVAGVWGVLSPSDKPVIGDVLPGLPAAQAKLQAGDQVERINGVTIASWEQLASFIHDKAGQPLQLEIRRATAAGTSSSTLALTPQKDPATGVGLIGIVPQVDHVKPGFAKSFVYAGRDIQTWTMQPLHYLSEKAAHLEGPKDLSGPLGIAQMVTKATKEGVSYVVYLIAIISTGLGLFNLFPIPVLDGGHIFLYLIEGLLGRPLTRKTMAFANAVGLSIVLTIFVYASYQDLLRLHHGFWH
jgi:regulator of sigma E protease